MGGIPYHEFIRKKKKKNSVETLSLLPPLKSNSVIKEYQDSNGFHVTLLGILSLKGSSFWWGCGEINMVEI